MVEAGAATAREGAAVRRRHIVYVQGYDPRGLAQYYRMFRTELRKYAALNGVAASAGRPVVDDAKAMASWTIETAGDGWQTTTRYDFLRWEELIKRDLERPMARTVAVATTCFLRLVSNGVIARFARAHWRFAIFASYPYIMLTLEAALALLAGWLGFAGLAHIGAPRPLAVLGAAALFVAVLALLLERLEKTTYVLYLMADWIFTFEFARGRRPDWDARIDQFARAIVDAVAASDADEFVVVGHSSGSFLGLEVLARAFEIDPALGRRGPRLAFLTLGGNLPIVGFHRQAKPFRARLARLATEPSLTWIDFQSRKDVMNFYPFDPVAGHGLSLDAPRCNPKIVGVRFRDVIAPEHYAAFRRDFFRVHFQFVMANERKAAYDYFDMMCGPGPIAAAAASAQPAQLVRWI